MPPLVNVRVDIERFYPPRVLGDDDFRAALVEVFNDPIRIERFIGDQPLKIDTLDQGLDTHSIEAMPRQELEAHQVAQGIGEGENFRRHAPFRLAWL